MISLLAAAERWRDRVAVVSGWRRWFLAAIAGALAVLALPPLFVLPALIPAFVLLAWLVDAAGSVRRAAFDGWWFGLGFFAAGLYWMSESFLVDARDYAWMIPFAIGGLSAVAALYIALAAGLARALAPAGPARLAALAALWVGAEWLRGWLLTGFPWNLLATVWMPSDAMLQAAALGGAYLLSLLAVAAAVSPAILAEARLGARARWLIAAAPYAVLLVVWGAGAVRLAGAGDATVPDVRLRLVQPNIAQADKWKPELRAAHLANLLELSLRSGPETSMEGPPTHVIWPETAVPFYLGTSREGLAAIARAAPVGGALITGALRGEIVGQGDARRLVRIWNSLAVVTADERVVARYDKVHLVPFGEYVPFRSILPIDKITPGRMDFSFGAARRALDIPGAPPASPLICYEAVFPGHVVPASGPRPGWLLNVTNDAWFGTSSGPHQHFAAARLRAVEEGLPLVRVANTGISGVVDPYGRIRVMAGLGRRAALDARLPAAIQPTIYAQIGDGLALALALLLLLAGRVRVLDYSQ